MQSENERWERTKRKLLWNFLENPGFQLSPIPEEASSSSSSSPDSLPELLVEPEPNRHDNDPEYYEELERRMRRYYRQLFLDDKGADFDEIEFEQFEANYIQTDDRSYYCGRDELEANDVVTEDKEGNVAESDNDMSTAEDVVTEENRADLDKIEDVSEANDGVLEENNYDSDKDDDVSDANDQQTTSASSIKDADGSEAEDVVTEENNADLDINENEFEANNVVLEEDNYDSDKDDDVSDTNDQQAASASSVKDADVTEAKYIVNIVHSIPSDKKESDSEANEIVAAEERADFDKIVYLSGVADEVRREMRYSSDNEEGIVEENLVVTKEHSAEANVIIVEKLIDVDIYEAVSTINENQLKNTANKAIKQHGTHVESPQKDRLSIDNSKEYSIVEEDGIDSRKLVESRSGYFMVSNYRKESDIDLNKNIEHDDSQAIGNQEDATINHDCLDFNKHLEGTAAALSKAKSASDSDESGPCHIISSTVVEIHESRSAVMRKFEDSPVLVPKFVSVSKDVSVPGDTGDRRDFSQCLSSLQDVSDKIIERTSSDNANEIDKAEADIEEPGTEVQRLLSVSEVTNVSQKPQADDEESIGADGFHSSTLYTTITERTGIDNDSEWDTDETDDNSFEIALRRGIFESKNIRKTRLQRLDEEMDTDEDFEPVEEIRAPREFGNRDSLHKVSADTEGSPTLAFKTQASADKLEEVSSDSHEINASLERGDERKSNKDPYQTPSVHLTNVINALDDIWSVSPMEVDIEQMLKETSQDKKRKLDREPKDEQIKRKKQENVAIQTSLNHQNWEDLRTNFFVGKPLVLRLCGCQDHVCSRQTYQTM